MITLYIQTPCRFQYEQIHPRNIAGGSLALRDIALDELFTRSAWTWRAGYISTFLDLVVETAYRQHHVGRIRKGKR